MPQVDKNAKKEKKYLSNCKLQYEGQEMRFLITKGDGGDNGSKIRV